MEKPSLSEVKEYFKNAETAKDWKKDKFILELENIKECDKGWVQNACKENWGVLWLEGKGYAEILTYKNTEPKFEITKEQIEYLSSVSKTAGIRLKEWFPEAFESVLEVGFWYKSFGLKNRIFFITKLDEEKLPLGYGFVEDKWKYEDDVFWETDKIERATTEEVTEALKKEAVKRGVCNGYFESIHGIYNIQHHQLQDPFYYADNADILYYKGRAIYSKGIWAEIIPTKTIQQAEELLKELGHEIKIV